MDDDDEFYWDDEMEFELGYVEELPEPGRRESWSYAA